MLLKELNDLRVSGNNKVIDNDVPLNTSKKIESRNNDILGRGQDAIVYQKKGSGGIGVVTKQIKGGLDVESNGAVQYLIQGNKLGNPFVPNVYEIRKVASQGRFQAEVGYDYFIKMEKLHGTLIDIDLDMDQSMALLHTVYEFDESASWKWLKDIRQLIEMGCDPAVQDQVTVTDMNGLRVVMTRTESCAQVVRLLRDIRSKIDTRYDIHNENIMIRLTSVGMQVVISDPLSDNN